MPMIELSNEQVAQLVNQLPLQQQQSIFHSPLLKRWNTWVGLSQEAQVQAWKVTAERGQEWGTMTEEEREAFINELVHEDRASSFWR